MNTPSTTSNTFNFCLVKRGPSSAVHSVTVDIPTRVTEALETLAASKKNIQCAENNIPVLKNFRLYKRPGLTNIFLTYNKINRPRNESNVL